jgi:hypothetical protein
MLARLPRKPGKGRLVKPKLTIAVRERFNMWPQTSLSEAQTRVLVDWILSQQ